MRSTTNAVKSWMREHRPLVLVICAGIFLRFFFLGKNDLWYDEAFTFLNSREHFFYGNAQFWNLPLYAFLTKIWTSWFGTSEYALRSLPALLSSASLPALYALAKKMFNKNAALWATGLMALSPFHLWYAQEARHYSLPLLLGLLATFFLYSFTREGKKKHLTAFSFFSVLGFYSNYFYLLFFLGQALWILAFGGRRPGLIASLMIPVLAFVPWLPLFFSRLAFVQEGFWIPAPTPQSLLITFENFLLGYNGTKTLYLISDAFLLLAGFSVVRFWRSSHPRKKELGFCIGLFLFPIVAAYVLSRLATSFYLDRGFLLLTPYFYAACVAALQQAAPRLMTATAVFLVAGALTAGDIRYFSGQIYMPQGNALHHLGACVKKPFRPLADFIMRDFKKDTDILVFGSQFHSVPLVYYMGADRKEFWDYGFFVFDEAIQDSNTQRPFRHAYRNSEFCGRAPKSKLTEMIGQRPGRIFFIGCDWERSGNLDENSTKVKECLDGDTRLRFAEQRDFDGIKIFIYERRW